MSTAMRKEKPERRERAIDSEKPTKVERKEERW
jgi:hypothetical protein